MSISVQMGYKRGWNLKTTGCVLKAESEVCQLCQLSVVLLSDHGKVISPGCQVPYPPMTHASEQGILMIVPHVMSLILEKQVCSVMG